MPTTAPPPIAPSASATLRSSLPDDLIQASAARLEVMMWIIAGADLLYLVLYSTIWADYSGSFARINSLVTILVSVALASCLRRIVCSQQRLVAIGIGYQIAVCLALETMSYSSMPAFEQPLGGISWVCVLIVMFPLMIPARPRTALLGSLGAAAMSPLAYGIALAAGFSERLSFDAAASLLLPPFVCALIAYLPARLLSGLGAEVGRARRLGAYELVEPIGHGGMGEVWRARHRLLIRPAAIKLIRPEQLGAGDRDLRLRERFEREAQATSLLQSPNTVELYDFGVTADGVFYYVMELLDGINLETLVARHGAQPAERVVYLLAQACHSLADAHYHGLIHRDIKPGNLLIARRGYEVDVVKVLDFGLVKGSPSSAGDIRETNEAELKGTPAFMAPEAFTGDYPVDARADIYALGCVAYWLLTGKLVFDAPSVMRVVVDHATTAPIPPSERLGAPLPAELEAIVMACLAKGPRERPRSALELRDRLLAVPLNTPWTAERAQRWWATNQPGQAAADERVGSVAIAPTMLVPGS
jgi:serine/threonine-protein kinase